MTNQLKLAALILLSWMSMPVLFAQAPSAPAQPDHSAAKFPADTRASEGNPYGEVAPTTQTSR